MRNAETNRAFRGININRHHVAWRKPGTDGTYSYLSSRLRKTSRLEAVKKLGESDSIMLLRKRKMPVHCGCDE